MNAALRWSLGLLLLCTCAGRADISSGKADPTAARWLKLSDASAHVSAGAVLEASSAEPLVRAQAVPFQDLELAPGRTGVTRPVPDSWEVPPFPQIGPPPVRHGSGPSELPASPNKSGAPAFQGVESDHESPSALLRPLPSVVTSRRTFEHFVVPAPFSSVRYTSGSAGLLQLTLYGGASSFAAEDAYTALSAALESRQKMAGMGKASVLGVFKDPGSAVAARVDSRPFADVPAVGEAHPEWIDPGSNQARQAPAFKDVSTTRRLEPHLDLSRLPRLPEPERTRPPATYWVLLIYAPDHLLTAEIALDQRLGTPQHLIELGLLLVSRWSEASPE